MALRRQLSLALEECAAVRRQLTETNARADATLADKQALEARASECAVERAELRSKLDEISEEKVQHIPMRIFYYSVVYLLQENYQSRLVNWVRFLSLIHIF